MYSTIVPYVNLSGGCGYFIFLIDTKISKSCHGISPTVHRFHQLLFSEIFKNIQMFCSFLFKAMHFHISYNFHFISDSEIFPKDLYTIYRKDRTGRKKRGGCILGNPNWHLIIRTTWVGHWLRNHLGKSRYNRCKFHLHRGIL